MIKVVHIIENLVSGGRERRLVELLKGSKEVAEIENYLIVLSDDIHYKEVQNMPHIIISRDKYSELNCLKKVYKYIKEIDPDIIHSWGGLTALYASFISFFQRRKFVNGMVSSASAKLTFKRFMYARFSFLFSDVILSNSQAGLKSFNPPKRKARQVYNGFNYKRLENLKTKDEIRDKFEIKTKFIIGMVANFTIHKDHDTYLEAANNILKLRDDVTFLCVGKSWNMGIYTKLHKNIEYYKNIYNTDRIIFTGLQNDVESISNTFDIGVLISHGEAISNSILEYMALGKPVIATDKGGTSELVEGDKNGFLIGYKNVEELTNKIQLLLNDEDLRNSMGQRSKEIIQEKFSIQSMVGKTVDIYRSLIKT